MDFGGRGFAKGGGGQLYYISLTGHTCTCIQENQENWYKKTLTISQYTKILFFILSTCDIMIHIYNPIILSSNNIIIINKQSSFCHFFFPWHIFFIILGHFISQASIFYYCRTTQLDKYTNDYIYDRSQWPVSYSKQ